MRLVLLLLLLAVPQLAWADDLLELPGGLVERVYLPGGPTVLLQAVPDLPSVSVALVVPAGARHDDPGQAGQAHLLEHLLFRATREQPGGSLLVNLEQIGARAGAETTAETIVFWETLPAQYLDYSLKTQAGRLKELFATEADLARERELVLWELAGQAGPASTLHSQLLSSLWPNLAPPAGIHRELGNVTLDSLKARYARTFDRRRAVLAIVGGFSPREVRLTLRGVFPSGGSAGAGTAAAGGSTGTATAGGPTGAGAGAATAGGSAGTGTGAGTAEESGGSGTGPATAGGSPGGSGASSEPAPRPPAQAVAAPVEVAGPAGLEWLVPLGEPPPRLAWLYLADAALSGGSGSELAHSGRRVVSEILPVEGLFRLWISPQPGESATAVEGLLRNALARLATTPLSEDQVLVTRNRALARFYRELEEPGARARFLGRLQLCNRLDEVAGIAEEIRTISPLVLREAWAGLLRPEVAAVGRLTGAAGPAEPAPSGVAETGLGPGPRLAAADWKVPQKPAKAPPVFSRHELENGLTVIVQTVQDLPTVTVRGYLAGGAMLDPRDKPGLTALAGSLLGEGTTSRPGRSFAWDVQDLGMELSFVPDHQVVAIRGWTLSRNFADFMNLLSDALRHPKPDAEALARARSWALGTLRSIHDNAELRAVYEFRNRIYPFDHPYGLPAAGTPATAQNATDGEILFQLRRITRPDRLVLVFSGDVSADQVLRSLRPELSSWYEESAPPMTANPTVGMPDPSSITLPGPGPEALVVMGHPGPARRDSDYYAFNLLNQVLGGNPVSSRLALRLRDREKLARTVDSRVVSTAGPVPWAVTLRTPPDHVEKAAAAVREEVGRIRKEPPTASELESAVRVLEGTLQVSQGSPSGRAELLSSLEFHRLSDTYAQAFSGIYRSITAKQVAETAKQRLAPDHLVTVVSSPAKK